MTTKKSYMEAIEQQRAEVVSKVIESLKSDGLSWCQGWTNAMSPVNATTGAAYKGRNRLHLSLIASIRGLEDPRWCTFNQARDAGWHVKKGARSAIIEKWQEVAFAKDVEDADGTVTQEIIRYPKCVGMWRVFNAEEIEGIPELPRTELAHDAITEVADELIHSSRCPVFEGSSRHADTACYVPSADEIYIPSRDQFASSEYFLRVLLHEMTHSTAVPLSRSAKGSFGTPEYAFEELIAELGAMFAASELGFDCSGFDESSTHYQQHVSYLKSWLSALEDDPDMLFKAATSASTAADYIIDGWRNLTVIADAA